MADEGGGGESLATSRSRRSRSDRSGRLAALEKLKSVKSGQRKAYEIEEEQDLYEEVTEEEYNRRVNDRRSDFVVGGDDAYKDDGYEIFDEEYEEKEREKSKKEKVSYKAPKSAQEKRQEAAKSSNIRSMFLSAPHKRKAETASLDNDDLLASIMKSKGLDVEDEDGPVSSPILTGIAKRQKSESSLPSNPFVKKADQQKAPLAPTKPVQQEELPAKPVAKVTSIKPKIETPLEECQDKENLLADLEEAASSVLEAKSESPTTGEEEKHCADVSMDEVEAIPPAEKTDDVAVPKPASAAKGFKIECINEADFEMGPEDKSPSAQTNSHVNLPLQEHSLGYKVFRMYWLDAYEDPFGHPGSAYFFGKTEFSGGIVSVSVVVKNIPRKMFFLPKEIKAEDGSTTSVPFKAVYDEVCAILHKHGITEFRCKESVKKFVFFTRDVPREASYLEVQYNPAKSSNSLPADLTGKTFSRVFGTNTSSLEAFILERKLKGPSWIDIKEPKQASVRTTTCRFELDCADFRNVAISEIQPDPPSLTVLTLQTRVVRNEKNGRDEVTMAAGLVHDAYPLTKPPPARLFTSHFCLVAGLAERALPYDFKKAIASGPIRVSPCDNERILISQLNAKITKIDPDIVVGHDLSGFTLPAVLAAMERFKIFRPSALSRLHRSSAINLARMDRGQLLPGRVLCDTKLSARELIQAKSYDLADLVQDVLSREHEELQVDVIRELYTRGDSLKQLCEHLMTESQYVVRLMAELNVLPLAAQITNICGNTLTQTLQKGRALRNEYLLLHAFTEKNFIVPDKESKRTRRLQKEKEENKDDKKKGPAYAGGLVLDPVVGFYDSMVLLMDFNSLYPSIIQEYNLCFTTCTLTPPEENPDAREADWEAQIPQTTVDVGVLPSEIKRLVDSRRAVKQLLQTPNLPKEKLLQYDIRQKALKLTANSMYGCLGFQGSRFYAKPIAALITQRGRDILMSAKSMAESMGHTIIYGDTDSIMINTGTNKIQQVQEIGSRIRQAINKQYRQLEIEVDGVFRAMLLLKKKKYAACTLSFARDGTLIGEKIEVKGLDIVRRDWAELARRTGRFVVDTLLDGKLSADDAVDAVHAHLREVAAGVNEGTLPLEQYIITKQLTKNVDDYPDAKNQSHVIVAKRFNSRGARKLRAGDTVPFVICDDGTELPHTQRAYHKDELELQEYADKLKIDKSYYLAQQVFPVVSRLVDPIQGTNAAMIAECLGLDPSKYNRRAVFDPSEVVDSEMNVGISLLLPQSLDSDLFQNVESFSIHCTQCNAPISIDGPVFQVVDGQLRFLLANCGQCRAPLSSQVDQLSNQLTRRLQQLQADAECVSFVCQICDKRQKDVLCNLHEEEIPPCSECGQDALQIRVQQFQSYAQLRYWQYMFNLDYYASKHTEADHRQVVESDAARIICGTFSALIDNFLSDNGFTTFSLKSYLEKLPFCNFTRRPLVMPDLDIP